LRDYLQGNRSAFPEADTFGGLDGLDVNRLAGRGYRARDGRLWFPSSNGLVVVDPADLQRNPITPRPIIEKVRTQDFIFDNRTAASQTSQDAFVFPPGSRRALEFEFTAPSLRAPSQVQFRYRLIGQSQEWIDAGRDRKLNLTNLRPGDYRLELKARSRHGLWSSSPTALSFRIEPHFYQTWWFPLAALTGLTVSLALYHRAGVHRQARSAVMAERRVATRDLHDHIGSALARLLLMTQRCSNNQSETLATIHQEVRQLDQQVRRRMTDTDPANDDLNRFLAGLLQAAEDYLRPLGIRCRFDVPVNIPSVAISREWRRNLDSILRETLANAVRHARATEIRFQLRVHRKRLHLTVQDNGTGFDPRDAAPGSGLQNIRERAKALCGVFSITSKPQHGAIVTLSLPI
jgi:signal transduction histidine kinase